MEEPARLEYLASGPLPRRIAFEETEDWCGLAFPGIPIWIRWMNLAGAILTILFSIVFAAVSVWQAVKMNRLIAMLPGGAPVPVFTMKLAIISLILFFEGAGMFAGVLIFPRLAQMADRIEFDTGELRVWRHRIFRNYRKWNGTEVKSVELRRVKSMIPKLQAADLIIRFENKTRIRRRLFGMEAIEAGQKFLACGRYRKYFA